MTPRTKLRQFIKTLGPGILFASTAIGVSHLVQSTRAGAGYGFALLWAVLAANLFKYPFFEYGSRYANAAGESLIDGYQRIGKWMLWLYFLITLASMFFVTAAVGFVTAAFMQNLFGIVGPNAGLYTTIALFVVCIGVLGLGKFGLLDGVIKVLGGILLVCTVAAFIIALINGPQPKVESFVPPPVFDSEGIGIAFIIALMGWMPTAVDLSTWNSLWTLERIKQTGYKPSLKQTLTDFNLGYWISAGLSVCFVTLGAFLLFGTTNVLPDAPAGFSAGVVSLYTQTFGDWSYWIISAAAFSIMFGTSIGVFDGYARALERTSELMLFSPEKAKAMLGNRKVYVSSLLVVGLGAFMVIYLVVFAEKGSLSKLVDLATTISFLIAPVIAIVNFALVNGKQVPKEARPGPLMKVLSYLGILFLSGFSIYYLIRLL